MLKKKHAEIWGGSCVLFAGQHFGTRDGKGMERLWQMVPFRLWIRSQEFPYPTPPLTNSNSVGGSSRCGTENKRTIHHGTRGPIISINQATWRGWVVNPAGCLSWDHPCMDILRRCLKLKSENYIKIWLWLYYILEAWDKMFQSLSTIIHDVHSNTNTVKSCMLSFGTNNSHHVWNVMQVLKISLSIDLTIDGSGRCPRCTGPRYGVVGQKRPRDQPPPKTFDSVMVFEITGGDQKAKTLRVGTLSWSLHRAWKFCQVNCLSPVIQKTWSAVPSLQKRLWMGLLATSLKPQLKWGAKS